MKRVKRNEWNNVGLVVDVAIMSVAISRDSSRVFSLLHQGSLASLASPPHVVLEIDPFRYFPAHDGKHRCPGGPPVPAAAPSEARRIFNEARAKRVKGWFSSGCCHYVCSHFAEFIASILVFIKARSLCSLTSASCSSSVCRSARWPCSARDKQI